LNIKGKRDEIYEEPGTWSWATPLEKYARVDENIADKVHVDMSREMEPGVRIKAEFVDDNATNGGFKIRACGVSIESDIPQVSAGGLPMYAYNLYIERGTLSPEPQILIHLEPGKSSTWTQRLVIADETKASDIIPEEVESILATFNANATGSDIPLQQLFSFSILLASTTFLILLVRRALGGYRQHHYTAVPDGQP
jgi:hypothetical protein